jgi:acetoin utilization deacetylase AcuC-like enzyme
LRFSTPEPCFNKKITPRISFMQPLVLYYPTGHQAHQAPGHPERPERVEAIRQAIDKAGFDRANNYVPPIPLSEAVLSGVHAKGYLSSLQSFCSQGEPLDMDTYTTPASWQIALNTAGGAASTAREVWNGSAKRGFALTRPPGHHATSNYGMGFCLLNNVAIAAQYLLTPHSEMAIAAERLAIIDLDLHHGNGTQDIFWSRGDVFYISTHQSPLYPGTGRLDECGAGAGVDRNANFPLPPGTGDTGFRTVMHELILPLLDGYKPQMLLVSFGFDPHWRDPLGSLLVSASALHDLILDLAHWADDKCAGKICLFLEGGYDLMAGEACCLGATSALLEEPWEDPLGPSPIPEKNRWIEVVRTAQKLWGIN